MESMSYKARMDLRLTAMRMATKTVLIGRSRNQHLDCVWANFQDAFDSRDEFDKHVARHAKLRILRGASNANN
jgi:hypothetical protein